MTQIKPGYVKWREANPELRKKRQRAYNTTWREANPELWLERQREYSRKWRAADKEAKNRARDKGK